VEVCLDSGENRPRELAKDALETIRRFCNKINDPAIQLELQEGATELETLLSYLKKSVQVSFEYQHEIHWFRPKAPCNAMQVEARH
jgi:hypothetical protein